MHPPPLIVVMGVSGSGKSVVGEELARRLRVPYGEGDDLHPAANVEKMAAGVPLADEDRWPWLDRCARWLAEHDGGGGVLACSALKRSYRERLLEGAPRTRFAELDVPESVLRERLAGRTGHFMPASLLASQLEALQPLAVDEPGVRVAVASGFGVEDTVDLVHRKLGGDVRGRPGADG